MAFLCKAVEVIDAIARTGNLMVGVPDYDTYVRHHEAQHPGEPVMSLAEFHRNRLEHRYGGGPNRIARCC
ncbi:hypothetical protein GCM10011390_38220 [Aureimonas endophytica]|uniref:YbdD/YjiX family protein n=1 Tax=Aureimonas endophytica TaxID=2027858 RepID=A0A917E8V1_9HYPH|nr:YbdD/YjiX family protein [Aureimonas endophytica]GGE15466.1 hypothetical protein GCM10011390_38220 [Aureimonas endophytica]